MRPITLLAAENGVGEPAADPRGRAPNVGAESRFIEDDLIFKRAL
jgi:hypothetical protein